MTSRRSTSPQSENGGETELPHELVAAELKTHSSNLCSIPQSLIIKTMEHMGMPFSQQAAVHVWLAGMAESQANPVNALTEHFREQQTLRLRPWRLKWQEVEQMLSGASARTQDQLRHEMLDAAKLRLITADDAQVLHWLLYLSDQQRLTVAATLLRKRGASRMQALNVLATQVGDRDSADAFITQFGEKLLQLPVPIWPLDDSFSAQQALLFDTFEHAPDLTAGDADHQDDTFARCFRILNETTGGGHLPVEQTPDGRWVADCTQLEAACKAAFDQAFGSLRSLEDRLTALGKEKAHESVSLAMAPLATELRKAFVAAHKASTAQRNRGAPRTPGRNALPSDGRRRFH